MKAAAASDYRDLARRRLPHFLFEYLDGGSYGEVSLRRNIAALESVELRQRVMRDVSQLDPRITLFGQSFALPVVLAPIGLAGLNARRGEVQAARAAAAERVPFCLSTVSACSLEEVVQGSPVPPWFQLYMIRDRGFMRDLLARARETKCPVLVFTVDMPVPGSRYRDVRSGLAGAPGWVGKTRRALQAARRPRWAWDVGVRGRPHHLGNVAPVLQGSTGLEDFFAWMRKNFDASVTWKDLEWVRAQWSGPLVLKGILDPSDARQAVACGVDGIVVSNHGGRQLDGVPATADVVPAVVAAIEGRIPVIADGGIRSGLDVVRMMALGAQAVMVGRSWVYALASDGEQGVRHVLELFKAEMRVAMALTGCTQASDIGAGILARAIPGTGRAAAVYQS